MKNGYSDHHDADKPGEETLGKFNLNCTSCVIQPMNAMERQKFSVYLGI